MPNTRTKVSGCRNEPETRVPQVWLVGVQTWSSKLSQSGIAVSQNILGRCQASNHWLGMFIFVAVVIYTLVVL